MKSGIGERQNAPVSAAFQGNKLTGALCQGQNIIPFPEPCLGGGQRNFRHELSGNLPERLQIACRERATKFVISDLHSMCLADVNAHALTPLMLVFMEPTGIDE